MPEIRIALILVAFLRLIPGWAVLHVTFLLLLSFVWDAENGWIGRWE